MLLCDGCARARFVLEYRVGATRLCQFATDPI